MKGRQDIEPARALLHPLWIFSLGVLLLNDHYLKGSGVLPGWLTGKLSDFAGLVVAPVLLAALFRVRTRRGVAIAAAAVGLGFAGLEMSSTLTALADSIYRLAGFSWRSTKDPTDLLALAVLPLAYLITVRAGLVRRARAASRERPFAHVHAARLLGTAGVLACTASSGYWVDQQPPCEGNDCDGDGANWPEDCNDYDPNLYPGNGCPALNGENVCDDGLDNDGDFLIDCNDEDCDLACKNLDLACQAAVPYVNFNGVGFLQGSTLVGTSVTAGSCVGADSPEVIFLGSTLAGTLTFGLPPGHGVHVRSQCWEGQSELGCAIWTGMSGSGGAGGVGGMSGSGGTGGIGGMAGSGGMTGSGGMAGSGGVAGSGGLGGMAGSAGSGGAGGSGGMGGSGGAPPSSDVLQIHIPSGDIAVIVEAIDPFQAGPFEVPIWFKPDAPP